ncbi:unnamed protein product [Symbiodinium sp. CCMP2592]|nr:unnamed protein product [Symbiodinium sp. CCMP2592]
MESMRKTTKPWQDPKRGKRRVQRKPATNKHVKVPYVCHRVEAKMQKLASQLWGLGSSVQQYEMPQVLAAARLSSRVLHGCWQLTDSSTCSGIHSPTCDGWCQGNCKSSHVRHRKEASRNLIYKNLEVAKSTYMLAKEKNFTYGGWRDVEVDEVDVGRFVDTSIQAVKNTSWEQRGYCTRTVPAHTP